MLPENHIIGWDLGGAHLKAAWLDGHGYLQKVVQVAMPLWQGLDKLDAALEELQDAIPMTNADHYLTMTGELVDLFEDRRQGVVSLAEHMASRLPPGRLRLYAAKLGFVGPGEAARVYANIASTNWHATAVWVGQLQRDALLIDIGSTTTDLSPLKNGWSGNRGFTDLERMQHGELLYSGVVRTPVMAITKQVPFKGEWHNVAAEHFATLADVYRVLDWLPKQADLHESADGKAKDLTASMRRLARMLGADLEDATPSEWEQMAQYIAECHINDCTSAVLRQLSCGISADAALVGAGAGRFLIARIAQRLGREYLDIDTLIGNATRGGLAPSVCAPAVAIAQLGRQELLACAS